MKRLSIFLSVLCLSYSLFSQTKIGDIIYPVESSIPLTGIDIIEVVKGNFVIYEQNGEQKTIMAIAIKKDGVYINLKAKTEKDRMENKAVTNKELYEGYNLEYYQNIQQKALKAKNGGMATTIVGISALVIGSFMVIDSYDSKTNTFDQGFKTGAVLELGGLLSTVIGIPIWVNGVKRYNKAQKGIDHFESDSAGLSLNFGMTQNGAGLILKL